MRIAKNVAYLSVIVQRALEPKSLWPHPAIQLVYGRGCTLLTKTTMTDPFSISLGILALIKTLQELATFVGKVETAPETLLKAQADILVTIDILEDIKHGFQASKSGTSFSPTKSDYDASMSSVLSQCQQICVAFQSKLSSCVSTHNDRAHVLYYRVRTAMRSETIDKFRTDLERSRQLVHMRLQLIST